MRFLLCVVLGLVLAGCGGHRHVHPERGASSESPVVMVHNRYIPIAETRRQEWGQQVFVPGYARQGIIVTPSRTWTYGQGVGWGSSATGVAEMSTYPTWEPGDFGTVASASNGACPPELTHSEKMYLGRPLTHLDSVPEIRNSGLSRIERQRLVRCQKAGFGYSEALDRILDQRVDAVFYARAVQRDAKGGVWIQPEKEKDANNQIDKP